MNSVYTLPVTLLGVMLGPTQRSILSVQRHKSAKYYHLNVVSQKEKFKLFCFVHQQMSLHTKGLQAALSGGRGVEVHPKRTTIDRLFQSKGQLTLLS